jgi:demethylspheroidene O-methyltransferase
MQQSTRIAEATRLQRAAPSAQPRFPADADTPHEQEAPTPSFVDQLYGVRDRLVSSAWFQRWAASFPLTRRTANRNARALFDVCAGFVYSQVLLACVRLKLFDILAERPLTIAELAPRLDLNIDATTRLVLAAQSLGLLSQRSGGRVGLAMLGAALRGNPGALVMIEHHALVYADLADPVALLRGEMKDTRLSRYWPYSRDHDASSLPEADVAPYTALMAQSQSLISDDVLSAYDFGKHRCLLDVGGGDGSFLTAAGQRFQTLNLCLFDLPAVAEKASHRFAANGLARRASAVGGDFKAMTLPTGADVVSLVRVALDHDDETVLRLFKSIRTILPADGVLAVAEPMRGLPGAETVGDAYFGLYLLAMGRGRARSITEHEALLRAAGFTTVTAIKTRRAILTGLMIAS